MSDLTSRGFVEGMHFLSPNFLMFASPIIFDGRQWISAQHLYQALKTTYRIDRDHIRQSNAPKDAWVMGHKVERRPGWKGIKLDVMRCVQWLKFSGPLKSRLLATGQSPLVARNIADPFWGAKDGGKNMYGLVVMEIRAWLFTGNTQPPLTNCCFSCNWSRRCGKTKMVGCVYHKQAPPDIEGVETSGWIYENLFPDESPQEQGMIPNRLITPMKGRCGDYQSRLPRLTN